MPASNDNDIPSRTSSLVAVSAIFLIITTCFFQTRLIWRLAHRQRGWDDLFAGLAYLVLVIQSTFGFLAAQSGFGKHRDDIPRSFETAMFWFYMYQICYKILGGLTKLCFCALYLRLFEPNGRFCGIVRIVAGVIGAGTVAFTFGTIWQCVPVHRNWDLRVRGHCVEFMAFWFSHAAYNTLMDIVVFTFPIPLIRTLKMSHRTKTGLITLFSLGLFTIAASIVRMAMLPHSANSRSDPTWGSTPALIWTEVEANTAVICCCLPALRPCAVALWRRMLGKTGPETPVNSGARSGHPGGGNRGLDGAPPQATMFSQARYSPPATSLSRKDSSGKDVHLNVLKKLGLERKGSLGGVREGNGAPYLELGGIYRTSDITVENGRPESMDVEVGGSRNREPDLDLLEFLREGRLRGNGRVR